MRLRIYYSDHVNISSDADPQPAEWDPCGEAFVANQARAYDDLRHRCPVAYSNRHGWSILRHADVVAVLHDPAAFSNRVSQHVAVPNGMDAPQHTAFREVVDRCFAPADVAAFRPAAQRLAADVLDLALATGPVVDVMAEIAEPYAARSQCEYLGWPADVADALQEWAAGSASATASGDRDRLARVAAEFDAIISVQLDRARASGRQQTVTERLVAERLGGQPLADADLVSMLRNWTAGELGTIAAAVGIVVAHLAADPRTTELLRSRPELRQVAMDEMLRLDTPLLTNRRRTTQAFEVAGQQIPADAKVTIVWPAAQRDPSAFDDATSFRLDRDRSANLLYGRGPHYCPGEGLARVELGAFAEEWLAKVSEVGVRTSERAQYPSGGYRRLVVELRAP